VCCGSVGYSQLPIAATRVRCHDILCELCGGQHGLRMDPPPPNAAASHANSHSTDCYIFISYPIISTEERPEIPTEKAKRRVGNGDIIVFFEVNITFEVKCMKWKCDSVPSD
jgi:hypothetical protein